jgi:hypothetical protein
MDPDGLQLIIAYVWVGESDMEAASRKVIFTRDELLKFMGIY